MDAACHLYFLLVRYLLAFLLTCSLPVLAAAQPSHAEMLEGLARSCFEDLTELPPSPVVLEVPDEHAYVRTGATQQLRGRNVTVLLPDSSDAAGSRLRVEVEQSRIRLSGSDPLQREARLALRIRATDEEGRVLADRSCTHTQQDAIPRMRAEALASSSFAATSPEIPPRRRWTRFLKPALLGAATLTSALLFFSLRSNG